MEMPPMEVLQMVAREAAREVMSESREADELRMAAAVQKGLKGFFDELGVDANHWVFLKTRYEVERETWSTSRRVVIGVVLVAVLTFAGLAARDRLLRTILDTGEAVPDHTAIVSRREEG